QSLSFQKLIWLSLPLLVILSNYENYMTSDLTVVDKIQPMKSLKEVVAKGYTIHYVYKVGRFSFRAELQGVPFYLSNNTEEAQELIKKHLKPEKTYYLLVNARISKEALKSILAMYDKTVTHM